MACQGMPWHPEGGLGPQGGPRAPGPAPAGCQGMTWHAKACHAMPWHALGCLGMPWHALACLVCLLSLFAFLHLSLRSSLTGSAAQAARPSQYLKKDVCFLMFWPPAGQCTTRTACLEKGRFLFEQQNAPAR